VTLRDNMWPSSGPSERGQSFSSVPGSDKALMSAPPPAHLPDGFDPTRRGSVPDGTLPFRRASGIPMPVGVVLPPGFSQSRTSRNGANGTIPGNIADLPRSTTPLDKDVDKYYEDDDDDDVDVEEKDDDEWDLFRMLKENPPEAGNDPFAVQTARSEQVEYVQESMASYLNRKTALLMLWFPLGVSTKLF
jgi:hypothetical protein